jgi:hypothetical protein
MNPIRKITTLIAQSNHGQIASLTDIEKPIAPPFTTKDGQQISEWEFETAAVFEAIAQTNQMRREKMNKMRRKR